MLSARMSKNCVLDCKFLFSNSQLKTTIPNIPAYRTEKTIMGLGVENIEGCGMGGGGILGHVHMLVLVRK